jgi:acyl-coenzyme A thioesterase PaaI-like protein
MLATAIQDQYADENAHCFGCGRLNPQGFQLKSHWDGEETVCRFTPEAKYSGGYPGYLYGGLIASLIDCHGAATAAAAKARLDGGPLNRFVTASLQVDFRKPTPIDTELEIRGRVIDLAGRKAIVELWVMAEGEIRAQGRMVLVQLPDQG